MTISTETLTLQTWAGNDVTTEFSWNKTVYDADDLIVTLITDATGVQVTQVKDTDYTISVETDYSGATITMVTAPATGETLAVGRNTAKLQAKDLSADTSIKLAQIEEGLDRITIMAQDLQRQINQKIGVADGTDVTLNGFVLTAEYYVRVNEAGDGFELINNPGTWVVGAGAPTTEGSTGNMYLNTSNGDIYGPKTSAGWGAAVANLTGADGTNGTDGLTVLNGTGAPSAGTGANGDFYIDTAAYDIYGPKAGGAWGSGTSLVGPTGPAGADGIFSAIASQAEAEAGVENTKGMTPLRTAQAIAALGGWVGTATSALDMAGFDIDTKGGTITDSTNGGRVQLTSNLECAFGMYHVGDANTGYFFNPDHLVMRAGGSYFFEAKNNLDATSYALINDWNQNEIAKFWGVASAVNFIDLTNAATGNGPTVAAAGDDTNIDLNLSAKGTGDVKVGTLKVDGDQTVGAGQDGYALIYNHSAGKAALAAVSSGGLSATDTQTFTASGTWTKPTSPAPGATAIARIQLWGAGGSGAANNTDSAAAGGGGGGYTELWLLASELQATETVTIGAGGASVTGNNNGNNGGNSDFGILASAKGGNAAGVNGGAGGPGQGIAVTGAQIAPYLGAGSGGASAAGNDGGYGGGSGGDGQGFAGGNSHFGGGGGGGGDDTTGGAGGTSVAGGNGGAGNSGAANATAGSQPGGGGGGCSNSSFNSGAGGDGKCVVTIYE